MLRFDKYGSDYSWLCGKAPRDFLVRITAVVTSEDWTSRLATGFEIVGWESRQKGQHIYVGLGTTASMAGMCNRGSSHYGWGVEKEQKQ